MTRVRGTLHSIQRLRADCSRLVRLVIWRTSRPLAIKHGQFSWHRQSALACVYLLRDFAPDRFGMRRWLSRSGAVYRATLIASDYEPLYHYRRIMYRYIQCLFGVAHGFPRRLQHSTAPVPSHNRTGSFAGELNLQLQSASRASRQILRRIGWIGLVYQTMIVSSGIVYYLDRRRAEGLFDSAISVAVYYESFASFVLTTTLLVDCLLYVSGIVSDFTELENMAHHYSQKSSSSDTPHTVYSWQHASGASGATSTINPRSVAATIIRYIKELLRFQRRNVAGDLPLHQIHTSGFTPNELPVAGNTSEPELLFLLLCHDEGRWATRLLQLDLVTSQASSDQTLFRILRYNYQSMRGKWRSKLSLRTLSWIKFVHFEMYGSEFVDVRKVDDVPPPNHAEYIYAPAPPDIMPPIGYKHMMHLYHHPECAGTDSICISRFPKKLKEKLRCCPIKGVNPGWGLQFVEGWDEKKIWTIVFVIFILGSLLVAMMLLIFGRSLQDAFSVAAYMATTATVTIGFVQAVLA